MSDAPQDESRPYSNIRDFLGYLVGKRVVDITQQDKEDWEERGESFIQIMFEDGSFVQFMNVEGFYDSGEQFSSNT